MDINNIANNSQFFSISTSSLNNLVNTMPGTTPFEQVLQDNITANQTSGGSQAGAGLSITSPQPGQVLSFLNSVGGFWAQSSQDDSGGVASASESTSVHDIKNEVADEYLAACASGKDSIQLQNQFVDTMEPYIGLEGNISATQNSTDPAATTPTTTSVRDSSLTIAYTQESERIISTE